MREPITSLVIVALAALALGPGGTIQLAELIGTQHPLSGGNDLCRLPARQLHSRTASAATQLLARRGRTSATQIMAKKAQEKDLPSWIRVHRQDGQQRMSIQVLMDGSEVDDQGYMDEHHLREAYQDLLLAEESIDGKQRRGGITKDVPTSKIS